MPKPKTTDDKKRADSLPLTERSSPGSGEEEEAADLQPKDIEGGETAR